MDSFFTKKKEQNQLSVKQVYDYLVRISRSKGNRSNTEKEGMIQKLLFDSGAAENKYIVRFIDKNLKIGCAEKSM